MIGNVKAKYTNGVLSPLEPLDITEGAEVALVIEEIPLQARRRAGMLSETCQGWLGISLRSTRMTDKTDRCLGQLQPLHEITTSEVRL